MLTVERLVSYEKEDLQEVSRSINSVELQQLVDWLTVKDDTLRYHSFLLLQYRSESSSDVYNYWDTFCEKLKSINSYQRSIGMMLIAANVKWDTHNKIDQVIDDYLSLLHDEKPITVRQCIQSLSGIVQYKGYLNKKIADELISLDINEVRATMQKLVLFDILSVLAMIKKQEASPEVDDFIIKALSGGMLDKKTVKQIEATL